MQIHVNRNGQQFGPYTVEEIQDFLQQGSLTVSDWAWHEGLADWVQISQLDLGKGSPQSVQSLAEVSPQTLETDEQIQETKGPTGEITADPGKAGVSVESAIERLRRLQRDRMPAGNKAHQHPGARSVQAAKDVSDKVRSPEVLDVPDSRKTKSKLIVPVVLGVCVAGLIGYSAVYFLSSSKKTPPKKIVPEAINNKAVDRLQKFGAHVTRDEDNQINGIQLSTNISAKGWELLVQLSNIQKLELVDCGVDDGNATNLGKFVHLRRLNLSGNPITDRSVDMLKTLTQLQMLDIRRTKVTKNGATALQAVLPDCVIDR